MIRRLAYLFTVMIVGISSLARADILFVDFNNNPGEITAARKAAALRGEKLVVLPDPAQKKAADDFRKVANRLAATELKSCRSASGLNCDTATKASQAATAKLSLLDDQMIIDRASLTKALAKVRAQNISLSSLIVSGHDGNSRIFGVNSSGGGEVSDGISPQDIIKAFQANPPLRSGIRSVFLWGCYTVNDGPIDVDWKGQFENAGMIAGFEGSAPLGDRPASQQLLKGLLLDKTIVEAKDRQALLEAFKKLPYSKATNSAICVKNDWIVDSHGVRSVAEDKAKCQSKQAEESSELADCYFTATKPGCLDIPPDPHAGKLFDFYNHLEQTSICDDYLDHVGKPRSDPQVILRLRFDREIRRNFVEHEKAELAELDSLLDSFKAPPGMRFSNIDKMTRGQWINKLNRLRDWMAKPSAADLENPKMLLARKIAYGLNKLGNLDADSIPANWVMPHNKESFHYNFPEVGAKGFAQATEAAAVNRYHRIDAQAAAKGPKFDNRSYETKKDDLNDQLGQISLNVMKTDHSAAANALRLRFTILDKAEENARRVQLAPLIRERIAFYKQQLNSTPNSGDGIEIRKALQAELDNWSPQLQPLK